MALNPLSIFSGPSPLPPQVGTVTGTIAPAAYAQGQAEIAQGSALAAGGTSALTTAQSGKLTAPEQAVVDQYTKGLENQALTTYAGMGITPSKSTSYLSTQEDINQKSLVMAQSFIDLNFKEAFAELTAGATFMGQGLQFEDAASKDLLVTAQMQIAQDQAYSKLIGDTLGSIAKIFAAPGVAAGAGSFLSSLTPNITPPSSGAGTQGMSGWE